MFKRTLYFALLLLWMLASCKSSQVVSSSRSSVATTHVKNSPKHEKEKQDRDFFDAEIARLTGNPKKSLDLYRTFVEAYPDNAAAHYILSRLYFQQNQNKNAEEEARKATELQPDNFYFRELYTQILMYQNKFKEADEQYELLIKGNPSNPDYLYRLAMYNLKNKRYEKALTALKEYERLTGFNEEIIQQRKNIYINQKNYRAALQEIELLKQNDPHNVEYAIMQSEIFEELHEKDSVQKVFDEIEKNYRSEPLAQVALAQYYLDKKDKARYHQFMQEVMRNKNLNTDTKVALVIPSLKSIETDSVSERERLCELTKSIYEEDPHNREAILLYADVLYYSEKNDLALKQYKRYVWQDSTKLNPYLQIMSLSFDAQQFDSTIYYGRKGKSQFDQNALPYFYLGIAFSQLHQTDSSLLYLQQALHLSEEQRALTVQILSSLGDAYNTKKDFKQSDSCFDAALKLSKDDAGILNNYAYYLSLRKVRLDDAEKMSKRSLELQPDSKSFLDTYGWILYEQGDFEKAKVYIEKAIKANGENDATLYEHLGDVYFKLKNNEQALYYWKQAKAKGEASDTLLKKINTQTLDE